MDRVSGSHADIAPPNQRIRRHWKHYRARVGSNNIHSGRGGNFVRRSGACTPNGLHRGGNGEPVSRYSSSTASFRREAKKGALLLAAGGATISIIEFAVAAEAFAAIMMADGGLRRFAGALSANVAQIGLHLSTRLCLAITEARDPFARDSSEWAQLQTPTALWELNDRDAALVLARYARARGRGAQPLQMRTQPGAALLNSPPGRSCSQILRDGCQRKFVSDIATARSTGRSLAIYVRWSGSWPCSHQNGSCPWEVHARKPLMTCSAEQRGFVLPRSPRNAFASWLQPVGFGKEELAAHSLLGDIFERSGEPLARSISPDTRRGRYFQ